MILIQIFFNFQFRNSVKENKLQWHNSTLYYLCTSIENLLYNQNFPYDLIYCHLKFILKNYKEYKIFFKKSIV